MRTSNKEHRILKGEVFRADAERQAKGIVNYFSMLFKATLAKVTELVPTLRVGTKMQFGVAFNPQLIPR